MDSKAITRIVLTLLLIGMLTLAFNFQLDETRANPAPNEAELPVHKVGEYWYFKYQNLTNPFSPWNLTERVIGSGAVSGTDCYVMNLTYKPNTPWNNTGMFNDMQGWFNKSSPLDLVKEEAHGFTASLGYSWVWNESFTYQTIKGPDFWPIRVGNALELNTTTTEDVWLTAYLGAQITPPYHYSHKGWFNVTWMKVEAIENVTVLGVPYENCFRIVTRDETNTTVISTEWYSPQAENWVKIENNVTKEYYDLISFHKFIVVPYVSSSVALNYTYSYNGGELQNESYYLSSTGNCTYSPPDANGVVNMTIPKQTMSNQSWYDPKSNVYTEVTPAKDSYGKLYTLSDTGYVDIISMTNNTGLFFWGTDKHWHLAADKWIGGDGKPGPAGSAWVTGVNNVSSYSGTNNHGYRLSSQLSPYWITTGFSENNVSQTGSMLNRHSVNATGVPYSNFAGGGIVTYVLTQAGLNIPFYTGHLDIQTKEVITFSPLPSIIINLFHSPNLYITDPMNRHIGTDPTTGKLVNEIPGAFYSGPGSEPQRIIIPNPLNGAYDIKLIGIKTETYNLVVELATLNKTTAQTYTGNITAGQILASKATISAGEIASTPPTPIVGGIYIQVNKLGLLAPYIALASTILIATAATAILVKHVKSRKKKQ